MPSTELVIQENAARGTHRAAAELVFRDSGCQKILDIPCGEGAFCQVLMEHGKEVHAADCQNILKMAGAEFHVADMNDRLPFEDCELDAVVSIDGIEHIERPFDFVKECQRVVRDDGWLIVTTPNASSVRSRWRWFLTGFHNKCKLPLDESNPTPFHHINMLGFPKLRYMLHTAGFRITDIATNRIKAISYIYLPFVPIQYLVTRLVFWLEATSDSERKLNREILRQMFSVPVLFGETLLVRARKRG